MNYDIINILYHKKVNERNGRKRKDMKNHAKYSAFVLAFIIIMQIILVLPASASKTNAELPNAYWALQKEYGEAKNNSDYKAIIKTVQKTYDLFVGTAKPETVADKWLKNEDIELNILTPYLLEAGKAAEALKDYDEMTRFYELYLIFVERQKMRWTEAQRINQDTFMTPSIKTKLTAYNVDPVFFTEIPPDNTTNPYTGAKFEPRNGIYYGSTNPYKIGPLTGNPVTAANKKTPSGALVYVQFKKEKVSDFNWLFEELQEKTDIIELAWNLDQKYISLKTAANETTIIEETAEYLAELGSPILLRVAAEMNVWNPPANADDFKKFFIAVADVMHKKAPNVAMLFSPNEGSAAGVTIMDYYPGDKYVDWVGISHYYQYYFKGNKDTSEFDRTVYKIGEYANPLRKAEEIVKLFGGKKPIMFSEYGVANYYNDLKESTVDWASLRLKQLQYYIPMFYPEIKAMFYFDSAMPEPQNYALHNSPNMNELYNKLMRENGIYLPKGQDSSEFIYAKLDSSGRAVKSNNVVINTYAEVMNYPSLTVTYSINGKEYAKSTEIPYRVALDLSQLKDGTHNIDVAVITTWDKKQQAKKTIKVEKKQDYVILYDKSITSTRALTKMPVTIKLTAIPASSKVIVDGKEVEFEAYNINGSNYFKLRDLAYAVNGTEKQFEVGWDDKKNAISLISNTPYTPNGSEMSPGNKKGNKTPVLTSAKIYLNGKEKQFTAYNIDGSNFFKLRDVMQVFNVYVGWDNATSTITLDTSKSYIP